MRLAGVVGVVSWCGWLVWLVWLVGVMDGWTIGGWIDGRTDRWAGWWMHGRWMGG